MKLRRTCGYRPHVRLVCSSQPIKRVFNSVPLGLDGAAVDEGHIWLRPCRRQGGPLGVFGAEAYGLFCGVKVKNAALKILDSCADTFADAFFSLMGSEKRAAVASRCLFDLYGRYAWEEFLCLTAYGIVA